MSLERIRETHVQGYRSTSDEAWGRRPICLGCRQDWPCDSGVILNLLDVDRLAQIIRKVDGNHSLGAGALAEAILNEMLADNKETK